MDTGASYPLAPRQLRLVRLAGRRTLPSLWTVVRVQSTASALDDAALARAVDATARCHEILRTRLAEAPGMSLPLQRVDPEGGVALETVDAASEDLGDDALLSRADQEAARRASSDGGVPGALWLRNAEGGALLLTAPSVHNDPEGMLSWVDEIAHRYGAAELPAPEIQFAQIAEWQTGLLEDPDEEEARAFWREHAPGVLADLPVPLGTPEPGRPRRRELGCTRDVLRRRLPFGRAALASALSGLSTPADRFFLAAWRVTVAWLTGDPGAAVGVWSSGRQVEALTGSLGPVGRYLPLGRSRDGGAVFAGGDRFADAVAATAGALDRAVEAQEQFVPGDLPDEVDGARQPDHFAVAFRHLDLGPARSAGGVLFTPIALGGALEPVGVELAVEADPVGFTAALHFDPRWIEPAAAGRLLRAFTRLAAAAAAEPRARLADLPLLYDEDERQEIDAARGPTGPAHAAGDPTTFPGRFAACAVRAPWAAAVVDGEATLDFADLEARSRRLADRLVARGVGPEVPVALVAHRDAATVVGLMAILRAGGTLMPLDPADPEGRVAAVLEQAAPAAVLTTSGAGPGDPADTERPLRQAAAEAGVAWLTIAAEEAAGDPGAGLPAIDPEQSAYLLFTSGTTGKPKGTRVSHRSLAHLDDSLETEVLGPLEESLGRRIERMALNAPLVFDASVKQWIGLGRGRTLITVPEPVRLDGRRFVAELVARRVDLVDATPTHLAVLLDVGLAEAAHPQAVLVGGEGIGPELWERLLADPGRRYVNLYGPTECTVDAAAAPVAGGGPHIGRPLPAVHLHVFDAAGRPIPRGAPGEIHIGGPGVARGYHGRPAATAECFVPDPFAAGGGEPGARLFASGDLARRRDDGSLSFLGRRDRQVKLRGQRLELGEIEAVLASHPAVRQAVAESDGDRLRAWAAVGIAADGEPSRLRRALREHLRHRLPEFMVPARLALVHELPRTARGKVDRAALAALGAQREDRGPRLSPRNATEARLAEIWCRVLGVDEVGVDENFFDLGGHSLLMVQLYDEIQQEFATELPILELFRHPTVADLAAKLEGGDEGPAGVDAARIQERARRQAAAVRRRREASHREDTP